MSFTGSDFRIPERGLVVEDRQTFQEMFEDVLKSHNFEVDLAGSLEEALAKLAKQFYFLAIIDLSLVPEDENNRDGLKVMERIFHLNEGTATLLATAFGTYDAARDAAIKYGAAELIEKKGLTPKALRESVGKIAEQSRKDYEIRYKDERHVFRANVPDYKWMHNILTYLKPRGGAATVYDLLGKLVKDLPPVLPSRTCSPGVRLDEHVFVAEFWSRRLEAGIRCRIGDPDLIEQEVQEVSAEEEVSALQIPSAQVIRLKRVRNLTGALYILKDLGAEDFIPNEISETSQHEV